MRQHGAACDAGAAGRLHDLHVAARIGMRRIDVHEVVAHGNAQTACAPSAAADFTKLRRVMVGCVMFPPSSRLRLLVCLLSQMGAPLRGRRSGSALPDQGQHLPAGFRGFPRTVPCKTAHGLQLGDEVAGEYLLRVAQRGVASSACSMAAFVAPSSHRRARWRMLGVAGRFVLQHAAEPLRRLELRQRRPARLGGPHRVVDGLILLVVARPARRSGTSSVSTPPQSIMMRSSAWAFCVLRFSSGAGR